MPSRTAIRSYAELNRALIRQVDTLNGKWGHGAWKPITLVHRHVDRQALVALHLMADFCLVSSLHDGMNLVAKEFVASRVDGDGVLILSAFTGAARELTDALIVIHSRSMKWPVRFVRPSTCPPRSGGAA